MSDQGKWFKLHVGWDDDPGLSVLSLEDQARWCKMGTYMKHHGTNGEVRLYDPCPVLQFKFKVGSFEDVLSCIKKLPGYDIGEKQKDNVTLVTNVLVTNKNWLKFQGDFSRYRVQKFRARVTAKKRREEKRRDEKRKEDICPISPLRFIKPTPEEVTAYAKTINFDLDGKKFVDFYEARGWLFKTGQPMKSWQAAIRYWKTNGFEKGGSLAAVGSPEKPRTEIRIS